MQLTPEERRRRRADSARRWRGRYPEKVRAQQLAVRALKRGDLVRTPCEAEGCDETIDRLDLMLEHAREVRATPPYRPTYDVERARWEARQVCIDCGEKPAEPSSKCALCTVEKDGKKKRPGKIEPSLGHVFAHSRRVMFKTFIRDLWREWHGKPARYGKAAS